MILENAIHITTEMNLWLIAILFYFATALLRMDSKGDIPIFYPYSEFKSFFTINSNNKSKIFITSLYLVLVLLVVYSQIILYLKALPMHPLMHTILIIFIYNMCAGIYWLIVNRKTSKAKIIFAVLIIILVEIFIFYTYKHVWHP